MCPSPTSSVPALLLLLLLAAVPAAVPSAAQEAGRYWIFLADKGPAAEQAPGPVTDRALDRRARRGTAAATPGAPGAAARLDAPVAPAYLGALARLGVAPRVRSRWLNAVSADLTPVQWEAVRALPFVRALRPVARARPAGAHRAAPAFPHDAFYAPAQDDTLDPGSSRRQLEAVNALAPLRRGIDGRGVVVGFLDTEYEAFAHPAFDALVAEGRLLAVRNFTGLEQGNRHGLAVASVAVGYDPGRLLGPGHGASVLAAVTEYAPSETNAEEDNFVAALEWMEAEGVDVVNVSLGYTTFDAGQRSYTRDDLDGDTAVTTRAVDRAAALGVTVVVAAGNEGFCRSPEGCWYYIGTPADADSAITVGGIELDATRYRSSSFGPTADGRTKPDVVAPARSVYLAEPGGGYEFSTGTSFAAPLVTGVVAQLLQVNPGLTPIEVRDLLRRTASQAEAPDDTLGWGIVDAEAALAAARLDVAAEAPPEVPAPAVEAYPNPTDGRLHFTVRGPAGGDARARVRLVLYDALGRRVAVPFDGPSQALPVPLLYDASALPPGVYAYALEGDGPPARGLVVVR